MASRSPLTVDQLLKAVGASGRRVHLSKLPRPTRAMLEDFVTYLVKEEGKTLNTARAYKSWCAKALTEGVVADNNVKAAVQALARYRDSK